MKQLVVIFMFLPMFAIAQMRSNLYQKPQAASPEKEVTKTLEPKPKKKKAQVIPATSGSLPQFYLNRAISQMEESPIVLPTNRQSVLNGNLLLGEVVTAEIKESLIAFSEAKAPIRAVIQSGHLKNAILVGEATLEKNSKRILISFNKLRSGNTNQSWHLLGNALDQKGILGIEGNLITGEDKYFAAEFLAAAAAGYADATIQRDQNAYGGYTEKPGADTFSKKALSSALSKTADRFADKLKSVPEFSVLQGPFEIQVLITEQPKLIE